MQRTPMSEAHARAICTWSYDSPYDIYNMGPWSLVISKGWTLGNPTQREREMLSVVDEDGVLLAYLRLSEADGRPMVGIGLHPEYCSRGLGAGVIGLGIAEHQVRAPGTRLWLEVRDWNRRAIRCYERSGFEVGKSVERVTGVGPGTFVVMHRDP